MLWWWVGLVGVRALAPSPRARPPGHAELFEEEDWRSAYVSVVAEPQRFSIPAAEIAGTVPDFLRGGTLYRCSPANFERGGERYSHVLDGDGYALALSFDADGGVEFVSRFVETEAYQQELAADAVLFRNTFGTQRSGGPLANALDVALKNVANTNIVHWGGRLFALWEAGAPHELDPATLETRGQAFDLVRGGAKATRGVTIDDGGPLDARLDFGTSFTAHPHVDEAANRLVAFTWAQQPVLKEMRLEFQEFDEQWKVAASRSHALPQCSLAPHDFAITKDFYVFFENRMTLDLASFVLGRKGPAQALEMETALPCRAHIVPRPDGAFADAQAAIIDVGPFFCIHTGLAYQEGAVVTVLSSGWDLGDAVAFPPSAEGRAPFLGAWSGPAPDYRNIPTTALYETRLDFAERSVLEHRVLPSARQHCVEHPKTHPALSGARAQPPRFVYSSLSNERGLATPPIAWAKFDTQHDPDAAATKTPPPRETWYAPPRHFCEELVIVPRSDSAASDDHLASDDCWLLGLLYDAAQTRTSLVVLDGARLSDGPVATIPLRVTLPHGLHGSWRPAPPAPRL